MTNEKFNWKSIFINVEENSEEKETKKVEVNAPSSFPDSQSSTKFPEDIHQKVAVDNTILTTIIQMYESGFESLNQPGYDFYEFFTAVKAVNSNDPAIYKMALTMAQGVDKKVTKSTLLTQANFYTDEIEKVHKAYESQGNTKKAQIQHIQKTKKEILINEVSALEKKLLEIQNQISEKKNELQFLDTNIISEVAEINQKIIANDQARKKILETIMTVVDGIKNNI